MPIYKINYFFEHGKYGWSETYYKINANPTTSLTSATNIITERVNLLAYDITTLGPRLTKVRISDVERQRDSLLYAVPEGDQRNQNPLGGSDFAAVCMLIRAESGADYRRNIYMRGQHNNMVVNGRLNRNPDWMLRFQLFTAALVNAQFGILAINRPDDQIGIATITSVEPPITTITTGVAHGLAVNDSVRIVSAPGTSGVRGIRTVLSVPDALSFTYSGLYSGAYRGGGKLYKRVPTLKPFTNLELIDAAKRDTGGPSAGPAGRRRRRALA